MQSELLNLLTDDFDSDEPLTGLQKRLLRILLQADTPVTAKRLAGLTGSGMRTVVKTIRDLVVEHGVLIVGVKSGAENGYYLSQDENDRLTSVRHLYTERRSIDELINSKQAIDANAVSRAKKLLEIAD